jgi:hypothetical protein
MNERNNLVVTAGAVVRAGMIVNRAFLAAVSSGLVATWLVPGFFERMLAQADHAVDLPAALVGIRVLMLVGIVMAVATDRLLVSLDRLVASTRVGDPFVPANAQRLLTIGWALLALQLLDLACAGLSKFWTSVGTAAPDGHISLGGWFATLMVFVLAKVFAAGAAMREDLEGTI